MPATALQPPDAPTPQIVTLGCRLNAHEGEQMRQFAAGAGLSKAVFVNTCAVTAEAVRQARQSIRRIRRESPRARIVVTGCAAQIEPAMFSDMPEVDHVVGNREKLDPATYSALALPGAARVLAGDIMSPAKQAGERAVPIPSRARAFVTIQNGCDHRCTFCVIPYGRGPSRSMPLADVVADVRRLVEQGVQEVVLTGVDITSWGADLGPDRGRAQALGDLVGDLLAQVPDLPRLRLSSLDQAETDARLLAAFADEPRLMPHVHLSLQHGNDLILKRMKRRHSRAAAIELMATLRRLRPGISIGADLIAGFPTETEAQFRDTLSLVEDCGIELVHAFPYSARDGTPAARMPQVPGPVVRERSQRLTEAGRAAKANWLERQVGAQIPAILEGSGPRDGRARTPHYAPVRVCGLPATLAPGDTVSARVTGHDGQRLMAETDT